MTHRAIPAVAIFLADNRLQRFASRPRPEGAAGTDTITSLLAMNFARPPRMPSDVYTAALSSSRRDVATPRDHAAPVSLPHRLAPVIKSPPTILVITSACSP